jgi:23S rRNA (guanosine2251-2'-O)-methyltransferase
MTEDRGRRTEDGRHGPPFQSSALRLQSSEFIYGRRPVLEALRAGTRPLHKLWIMEGTHGTEEILRLARERGVPVERARREHLDKRVHGHHQGILAQASAAAFLDLDGFLAKVGPSAPAVLVALDEIQDPHNVGAILRSAGFFGVSGALVPRWRSAPVGETAARVSSGAIEHIPLLRVRNLADSILTLQKANFEVIGADIEGSPLNEHQPSSRTTLVFGSEAKGLRRLVRERCDKLLKIPGAGPVGSLNVGGAAAIFLYEFCRRSSIGRAPVL